MKVAFRFRSVADWSDLTHGEAFVRLLSRSGLTISKAGAYEPLRNSLTGEAFPKLWQGHGLPGNHCTCTFLFKGIGTYQFAGLLEWKKNLKPSREFFNHLTMRLIVDKQVSPDFLISLGDSLFHWARATAGSVTDDTLYPTLSRPDAMKRYLPGVFWLNYYGKPYLAERTFVLPEHTTLSGGVRVQVGLRPDDPVLRAEERLLDIKRGIGLGWFGEGAEDEFKLPVFDFSELQAQ